MRTPIQIRRPRRSGIILITAMWITVILGALVLIFARSMRVEATASANRLAAQQASAIEMGAEAYVISSVDGCGGDAVTVLQTPAEQMQLGDGYFWILQPYTTDDYTYAFGITDENSKTNVNYAGDAELAALPGMPQDVADSIVTWRNSSGTVTGQGVGSDYYQTLPRPYTAKSSLFESIEELYFIKDVTDQLMWGYDLDHNGMLDTAEQTAGGVATAFNAASDTGRGIAPFITVWGKEPNQTSSGKMPINISNINGPNQALSKFLQSKIPKTANQVLQIAGLIRTFNNVFDFAAKTRMSQSDLTAVFDGLTYSSAANLPGLVNVNTASEQVLMCLPGLTQADADNIISSRPSSSLSGSAISSITGSSSSSSGSTSPSNIAWVMTAIGKAKAAAIGKRITGKSFFYSADIVAVSGNGMAFKRVKIVVDARSEPPMIVYRKDMTPFGWPLSPDIRTALRTGQPLPPAGGMGTGGANGLSQF